MKDEHLGEDGRGDLTSPDQLHGLPPTPVIDSETLKPAHTSGLAIASVILGIAGIATCGTTALIGFVLGIVALVQIGNNRGRMQGHNIAIAGLAASCVITVVFLVAAMLIPICLRAREKALESSCMSNQRQIALAMQMYAQDNNETLPNSWSCIQRKRSALIFHCPSKRQRTDYEIDYGINVHISGIRLEKIAEPSRALFIADARYPLNTIAQANGIDRCHNGGCIASYVDGHVAYVKNIDDLALIPAYSR